MEVKHKASNVIEFVLGKLEYNEKLDKDFNIGEWYGFKDDKNNVLRAKYIGSHDSKNVFNIHKSHLPENEEAIAIVHHNDQLVLFKVLYSNNNTIIKINISKDGKLIPNEYAEKTGKTFNIDQSIIENIKILNKTIVGIRQRVSENDILDEKAIQKLFNNFNGECGYCGVLQEDIDTLDKKLDDENGYGLTKRSRGYKMEVDQIEADKGYIEGNIVLCCYWCNNAKTDTFTIDEFYCIAKGINKAWETKFKKYEVENKLQKLPSLEIWKKGIMQ